MAEFNSAEKLNIEEAEIEAMDVMTGDRVDLCFYNEKECSFHPKI